MPLLREFLCAVVVGILVLLLSACVQAAPQGSGYPVILASQSEDSTPMSPIIHAPDFPPGFAWLNTDQPLSFKGNLKGHVVVMDFWCYCCINCMHVLPDLEFLEEKYKDQPVVIIGVHSNKYDNESDPANIRAAIQRYQITHPILVDEGHKVWDAYDVSAWPTLVVVGADGNIVGGVSGEGHRDLLDQVIAGELAKAKAAGTLAAAPLKLAREGKVAAATGLAFPGKVIADVAGQRLLIVDSNHNRLVITSYPDTMARAHVLEIIGKGETGAADGSFDQATFNRPQGAALAGNTLWIADTENHLIRRADLEKKTVSTVLGTGKQVFDPEAGKTGRQQGLNSPWDVALGGNRLYISQAGQHQIFAMNLMTGMTEVAAGTGRENIRDGGAHDANLAQPSGLALDVTRQTLYFADSEVSAIRGLELKAGTVFTVIGHGLFDFGDHDGDAVSARLQHALGVAVEPNGELLVADTYNHKIKELDPQARMARTIAGNGKPGTMDEAGHVQFFEPASLSVASTTEVFVADTNNHRIVRLNPENGEWKELIIEGLSPTTSAVAMVPAGVRDGGNVTFGAGDAGMTFKLKMPVGDHLTAGAPISVRVTDGVKVLHTGTVSAGEAGAVRAVVPAGALAGRPGVLYVEIFYTHCSSGLSAVCTPAEEAWKVEVTYGAGGVRELLLR